MEEKTGEGFSLESIDFIFRHPWTILFSFLIIANIFHAYAVSIPPEYRSAAILAFSAASGAPQQVSNEKKEAAERIISGPNINAIAEQAMKDEPPEKRTEQQQRLIDKLQDPRSGIRFTWDQKAGGSLLTIGFGFSDPKTSCNTVKATMDMLIAESERKVAREMETRLAFLNDQQKFYRGKIEATDREMESIKDELLARFPELSDEEKEMIARSSADVDITKKGSVQKLEAQEETISKLKENLAELLQKRDKLSRSLESGTFVTQTTLEDISKEDAILTEYAKAIVAKELEITNLTLRGYKEAHPHVKQLRREAEQLKRMKQQRMGQLRSIAPGSEEYQEVKEKVRFDIEQLDMRIALVQDSLAAADESRKTARTQLKSRPAKASDIKERVSRLMSLKSERDINENYLADMKRKLADLELKMRTEQQDLGFKIEVVQEPSAPDRPDPSRAMKITFQGLMIALLAGGALAYLLDMLKNAVHTDKELAELLGIPVLATIDKIATPGEMEKKRRQIRLAAIGTAVIMVVSRVLIAVMFGART